MYISRIAHAGAANWPSGELAAGADGPIIEGFVVAELLRQAEWSEPRPQLSRLRDRLGQRFAAGVVLHTGARGSRLGDRLHAVPIAALWEL